MDCLKFLIRLCTDMGLKESQEYSLKLKKVEKAKEAKTQGAKAAQEEVRWGVPRWCSGIGKETDSIHRHG